MALVKIKAERNENLLQLVQKAQGQTDLPVLVVYREKQARIYFDGAQKDRERAPKN